MVSKSSKTTVASGFQEVLGPSFFDRRADSVARELLGCWLIVQRADQHQEKHRIFEAEAYLGPQDLACHGRMGPTPRNRTMFGPAGYWYVYLCYGMHWMLNVVTGREGLPAAVLLRGVGESEGPGRLTKMLGVTKQYDGKRLEPISGLWIERGDGVPRRQIQRTPRIGVGYAKNWADKPLRYLVNPSIFTSRTVMRTGL
ncbi:MAG: DNA-3-methyladenine glycosylase [Planctomycetaceae bacterium]|nr:DNA-3-methyladenine glycosylase [Planctomycetaceae bacterium]MBT6055579.1 DNA-3-methyladenine glycosylase [Planctomycetaceae bacterium]MBT6920584.1 DNA-3-methyladenine glycosylase [Planctomycetaceae bacterium]